ncbi:hypothetical protein GH714_017681 [Hevea brasiliensis]|uniref:Myb/SANT-like domain-containing protein n=1 Tax=Hevea brasiliensis TaxID=3981 RepID=A0A6A6KER5_HEVBR|nr:hypothetical protein GH714_017681 [Hevea brasiliensis]
MPRRKKIPNQESSMYGRDHVVWTNEMDNVLINAMLEEDHKGNRPEGTWNTRAFDNMLQVLRAAFGPVIQKSNIKNRMKTLKRTFAECKDLFHGLSGFAWNPVTKLFEATFDVWEQLIQEKPEARKWMQTPINNYDKLYELYGNQRATGEYAESAREKVTNLAYAFLTELLSEMILLQMGVVIKLFASIIFSMCRLSRLFMLNVNWLKRSSLYFIQVYADGMPTLSSKERKATLREFYAIIYPSLRLLEGEFIELEDNPKRSRGAEVLSRKRVEDKRKRSERF